MKNKLTEANESFKIEYESNYHANDDAIKLSENRGVFELRFKALPSKIILTTTEKKSEYEKMHDRIASKISQLYKHDKVKYEQFWEILSNIGRPEEKLEKQLQEEYNQIFEHILTLTKSKLLEYAHDCKIEGEKFYKEQEVILNEKLDELLK